jgi:RNA polymerase sigma factor (sigma-70 family)
MPLTHDMDCGRRLQSGDEQVLEDVLRSCGPAVRSVLRRKYAGVLSLSDLDDVLAIGLFRLWVARERFDDAKGSLRVWFLRIADNAARDVLRHGWQKARQLETTFERDFLESQVARQDVSDSDSSFEPGPELVAVREIVIGLPDMQRRIVLADSYSRDGSASSQHLAAELGIPPGTVRVYRKRALDRIRDELKQRGFGLD